MRDEQEFNEFKTLIEPLGYFTDKVSYAKTPTYFWEHNDNKYEYHEVGIPFLAEIGRLLTNYNIRQ